jgi:hypothetical protein
LFFNISTAASVHPHTLLDGNYTQKPKSKTHNDLKKVRTRNIGLVEPPETVFSADRVMAGEVMTSCTAAVICKPHEKMCNVS